MSAHGGTKLQLVWAVSKIETFDGCLWKKQN